MQGAQSDASLPLIDPQLLCLARFQRVRGARLQRLGAGEAVMREGEVPEVMGVVLDGALVVSSRTPCGRVATLSILGPGDLVGHHAVGSEPTPETAPGVASLVDSTLLTVPATSVSAVLPHDTVLLQGFASAVAELLDRAQVALARALTLPVIDRVRHALRDLAARFGTRVPGGTIVMLPVSQELLASLAGATRESVNRALRELKAAGAVRIEEGRYVWTESEAVRDRRPEHPGVQGRLPGLS